jgi:hypothetical protein
VFKVKLPLIAEGIENDRPPARSAVGQLDEGYVDEISFMILIMVLLLLPFL